MSYKRVIYQVEMSDNENTIDYKFDALTRLMTRGQWSKTFVSAAQGGASLPTAVVQNFAQDDNGDSGLTLALSTVGGLPAEPANGVPYSLTFLGSGGVGPYTFSLFTGTLPPGLTLAGATGVLSGTPDTPGFFSFVIRVIDALNGYHNGAFALNVVS